MWVWWYVLIRFGIVMECCVYSLVRFKSIVCYIFKFGYFFLNFKRLVFYKKSNSYVGGWGGIVVEFKL